MKGLCKICGKPEVPKRSRCRECLCRQQRTYHQAKEGTEGSERPTWLGDRMAEIKHIEIRNNEKILRKAGFTPFINAVKADKIIAKFKEIVL